MAGGVTGKRKMERDKLALFGAGLFWAAGGLLVALQILWPGPFLGY